ncbi:MAG TPA: amidohydrolase family protein [Bacteroidia bacterium]|nr:amidohydrolase family protein [Bacteroidia bacterium]
MKYYNTHTHIFSAQYVPNNVVGVPVMRFLAQYSVSRKIVQYARWLTWGKINSRLERVAKFAEIGLGASQEAIFNQLQDYYKGWGEMRFVILMMDMEQMGAGLPLSNYKTQLDEIIRLRAKGNYANILLPFICIDPRRPEFTDGDALLNWVRPYFEKYGFVGIKMYPALGYYPFDEKLDKLYAWAEENGVPLLYHAVEGVIHYRGSLSGFPAARYANSFHTPGETKPVRYQRNFTEPENYRKVLEMFPRLKVCLAHYGGDDVILKKDRWYKTIRELVATYDNVYTDVSFSLYNEAIFETIHHDVNDSSVSGLGDRILFGTDYYVVEKNKDEAFLRDQLRESFKNLDLEKGITKNSFDRIASVNPGRFLTSTFYSA